MSNPNSPDSELLKTVLEPLLDDFQYWFGRSQAFLEQQRLEFMSETDQAKLLERVSEAQREVSAAKSLLNLTDGQVGIETSALIPWHGLVTECWQVASRFRAEQSNS